MLRYDRQTKPGLVALYDIRPGNWAGPFLQPRSPHGASLIKPAMYVCVSSVSCERPATHGSVSWVRPVSLPLTPCISAQRLAAASYAGTSRSHQSPATNNTHSSTLDTADTHKLCGRPPQYAPAPCKLTFWPWQWCPSQVWRGLPLCQF